MLLNRTIPDRGRTIRRRAPLRPVVALTILVALAGCGSGGSGAKRADGGPLTVSAATSLKTAFTEYGDRFAGASVRLSFAGSDQLAAQVRRGARPDVFAAANTKLPAALAKDGLAERPAVFAANRLVLAVPAKGGRVRSLADLALPGITLAVGAPGVPVGSYTREVLGRLPPARSRAILANVRSNEPDVGGVVGKLAQGAVDAGFVYVTDVRAAKGRLRAIELPARLRPSVAYAAVVVRGSRHRAAARRFVAGLRSGPGRETLRRAGFAPPPR